MLIPCRRYLAERSLCCEVTAQTHDTAVPPTVIVKADCLFVCLADHEFALKNNSFDYLNIPVQCGAALDVVYLKRLKPKA